MCWILIQFDTVVNPVILVAGLPVLGVSVEVSFEEEVRGDEVCLIDREALDFVGFDDNEGEPRDVDNRNNEGKRPDGGKTGASSLGISVGSGVIVLVEVEDADVFASV